MKKRIVFVTMLTLLLCGCGKQTEESNIPASAPAASIASAETEGNSPTEETAAETETVSAESESETAVSETEANTEETTTIQTTTAEQITTTVQAATTGQTTATTEQTTTGQTTTAVQASEENRDADFTWFKKGVYAAKVNGITKAYYCFYDERNGKSDNADGNSGTGFTCEQTKKEIIFHMGDIEDTTIMTMDSPDADGNMCGTINGITYAFTEVTDADPKTFDVNEYHQNNSADDSHSDSQNPIMNFIGNYQSGRASMFVEGSGDNTAKITISWGGSADTAAVWTMSGECVTDGDSIIVSYHDSVSKGVEYNPDGTVKSETTEYTDGSGSVTFSGSTAKWNDDTENDGDTMVFDYVIQ